MFKYIAIILLFISIALKLPAQQRSKSNWIDFGGSHASKWLQIAPGKLGPNALPVPHMDYALIGNQSKFDLGAHYHQMPGDTAINSYFNFHWNIAPGRAMVQIWGQATETFRLSNELRDFRQITPDDEGWVTQVGDLYISAFVQLVKAQKYFPDVSINFTQKTTTGENDHGRYTDSPMSYFYLALGKSFILNSRTIDEIRIAALAGFYVWQTNKVEMSQDEGPVVLAGLQIRKKNLSWFNEIGGYNGYGAYEYLNNIYGEGSVNGHNDPFIYRTRFEYQRKTFSYSVEYQTGFRDYHYQTLRIGFSYNFWIKPLID